MKKIESIYFSGVQEGIDRYYRVGCGDITEIKEAKKNGQLAELTYYEIYRNGKHYSDLHQFTEIVYEEEVVANLERINMKEEREETEIKIVIIACFTVIILSLIALKGCAVEHKYFNQKAIELAKYGYTEDFSKWGSYKGVTPIKAKKQKENENGKS